MSEIQLSQRRTPWFDSDGLPWTARLELAWLIWLFALTGGLAGIPLGLYLGLWIRTRTGSATVLIVYLLIAASCILAFVPKPLIPDTTALAIVLLWFAEALIGRRQISRYYREREGNRFDLSLASTLLLGPWYLNYRLRPEYTPGLTSKPSL